MAPDVLGATPFNEMADVVWSGTESPYGPSFLTADGVLDQASGHSILPDLVLLRLLEVGGIALIVAATPTLARSLRRDPAHAVLIGAGSPLVLLSLVAGSHNDALMVGLLMAGLAVAKRVGTVPGIMLCALAAGVKSPAALGVLFLGWVWAGPAAVHAAAHRAHRRGRFDRPLHPGGSGADLGDGLGVDPHHHDRGCGLHRGYARERRCARRLHREPRPAIPDHHHGRTRPCSACSACSLPSTSDTGS